MTNQVSEETIKAMCIELSIHLTQFQTANALAGTEDNAIATVEQFADIFANQMIDLITTARKEGAIEVLEGLKQAHRLNDGTDNVIVFQQDIDQAIKTIQEGE